MLSSAVHVSVPKKWNHGQMTWFQERKLPPSQIIYREDLLHGINNSHKTANEYPTCCSHHHLLHTNFHTPPLCHDQRDSGSAGRNELMLMRSEHSSNVWMQLYRAWWGRQLPLSVWRPRWGTHGIQTPVPIHIAWCFPSLSSKSGRPGIWRPWL